MDHGIREALDALPRLSDACARSSWTSCKICEGTAEFFDVTDFNKCSDGYRFGPSGIHVHWHRCRACSFIFTRFFDTWEKEDFVQFVYNDDYLKIDGEYLGARPERTAAETAQLLRGHEGVRILDYGSGAGVFARKMAEHGFRRVENYDPLASPTRPIGRFDVITCFEVVEHSPDPLGTLCVMASLLAPGGAVILGTALQPTDIGSIRTNWQYAAPRNGHLSLYSDSALVVAAGRAGLRFHRGGRHALTFGPGGPLADLVERQIGPPLFFAILGAPTAGDHPGWHSAEKRARGPFRWTADRKNVWTVEMPPGVWRLQLRVPIWGPAATGTCRMALNGEHMVVRKDDDGFIAETKMAVAGRPTIALETPELRSPHELTGSPDKRRLGVAIPLVENACLVPAGRPAE
jgi:SAM-dependent methyltransferase